MLRRLKSEAALTLVRALTIFVCAFGVSAGLCAALFPMTDLRLLALICGAGALLFAGAAAFTAFWPVLFLPLTGVLVWAAFGGGPLRGALNGALAALLYPGQTGGALLLYRTELTRAIGCFSLFLCAAACLTDAPFLMGLLSAAALVPAYLTSPDLSVLWAALAAAGILLMLAAPRPGAARLSAVLVTAALIVLTLAAAPKKAPENAALREAAETAYGVLEAYLPARDSGYREGYSLRGDGYLPLADDYNDFLGGSADPENTPVMEVWTDRTVYLRGSPRNAYTGLSWQDTLLSQRILYADVFQTAARRALLNQEIPQGAENEPLQAVRVRVVRDAATTLFVPDRTQELTMGEASMAPYYNAASEIFLSRNLRAGDSYSLTYLPVSADRARTRAWVEAARDREDPRYPEILDNYLSVPEQIRMNRPVTDLSSLAAGGQENLFDRALSIRDWLRETYPYTLDVSDPPPNTDFVSWFLLGERKGYCTYFASAMTILCRLQGIPARFVAGYLVRPDAEGYAVVTGKMGHAWTEVYLKGFGWLTLDATPGTEETVFEDAPEDLPENTPEEKPTEKPQEDSRPTIPPVAEEEEEEDPPVPPDEPENRTDEPPQETPAPGPAPTPENGPDSRQPDSSAPFPWIWLALIPSALLAGFLIRLFLTDPVRAARRRPGQAARILFTAVETALTAAGRPRSPLETLDEYAHRVGRFYPDLPLGRVFAAYSAETYGEHAMNPSQFIPLWKGLMKTLSPWDRIRVRARLSGYRNKS